MSNLTRCRAIPRRPLPLQVVLTATAALLVSACAQGGLEMPSLSLADPSSAPGTVATGSIATAPLSPLAPAAADVDIAALKPETGKAITRARQLREEGQKKRALEALDRAAKADPEDKSLARERGMLALELGELDRAERHLRAAIDPDRPDWRTHSALGAALAAAGRHVEAQSELARALELAPNHPSVLNNLALSYALDGKRDRAEILLRKAAASGNTKTKQNLALILGLEGDTAEAVRVASDVMPPAQARANATYLQQLRAQSASVSRADPSQETIRSARAE